MFFLGIDNFLRTKLKLYQNISSPYLLSCPASVCKDAPASGLHVQEEDPTLQQRVSIMLLNSALGVGSSFIFFSYICVSSGSIWAPIPYKVLLLDPLTYFQQRHTYLRSRHSLKVSQRPPCSFGVFRRLWKWFSWTSSGWPGTWKLWRSGCSPPTQLVPGAQALLLLQRLSEGRPAAELFALLEVLVSSGPNCIFHIFSEMS